MTWLFIKMRMLNHRKQYFTQFLRPLDGVQDGERDPRVEETWLTRDLYTLSSAAVILIFLMPWLGAATASQTQGRFCPSGGLLAASLVYPIDCNLATNQTKLYSHTPPFLVPYVLLLAYWRHHFLLPLVPTPRSAHFVMVDHATHLLVHPGWCPKCLEPEPPVARPQTTDERRYEYKLWLELVL